MEWLMIAATVASLGLAVAMSIVAWHLLHRDRERSAARIEALEAMAFADQQPDAAPARVEQRISADPSWDSLLKSQPRPAIEAVDVPVPSAARPAAANRPLFDEAPVQSVQHVAVRRSLAVAAMVLVLAGVVGAITLLRSPSILAVLSASGDERAAVNGKPLELLSLRHAVDQTGVFAVTGLVQNPAEGQEVAQIEAVLYLFDETGQFLTSGRAPIEIPTLGPGDESAFVVRVPTTATISRYRVGFKRADGRAVAHVDHRGHLPEGTSGDVLTGGGTDVVTPARAVRPNSAFSEGAGPR